MNEPICKFREVASSVPNPGTHFHLLAMTCPENLVCRASRGTSKFTKYVIARRNAEHHYLEPTKQPQRQDYSFDFFNDLLAVIVTHT